MSNPNNQQGPSDQSTTATSGSRTARMMASLAKGSTQQSADNASSIRQGLPYNLAGGYTEQSRSVNPADQRPQDGAASNSEAASNNTHAPESNNAPATEPRSQPHYECTDDTQISIEQWWMDVRRRE
ncbi:hypothetical protein IAU59_002505 [Kwoniella sp. CBS 9459]